MSIVSVGEQQKIIASDVVKNRGNSILLSPLFPFPAATSMGPSAENKLLNLYSSNFAFLQQRYLFDVKFHCIMANGIHVKKQVTCFYKTEKLRMQISPKILMQCEKTRSFDSRQMSSCNNLYQKKTHFSSRKNESKIGRDRFSDAPLICLPKGGGARE